MVNQSIIFIFLGTIEENIEKMKERVKEWNKESGETMKERAKEWNNESGEAMKDWHNERMKEFKT